VRRYAPPPREAPRIERSLIPSGFSGTTHTAAHVARLIRDGARDFYVRQKAIDILLARGVPGKDYRGEIDALFRWVQRNVRYTRDPFRVEVLHAPRRMLELKAGDCDDMTILLGAMVKSIGHPVRIVLTGPNGRRPDLFSHIYLEAGLHGQWIPLDATMPHPMGWSPRAPVRLVLPVEENSTDDNASTSASSGSAGSRARIGATSRSGSAASAASAAAGTATSARARARLASDPHSRNPAQRNASARSESESAVGPPAQPSAPRSKSLAQSSPPLLLAERTGDAGSTAHNAADRRTTEGLGTAAAEVSRAAVATNARDRAATVHEADATLATSDTPTRGDGAPSGTWRSETARRMESRRTPSLGGYVRDAGELYSRFTSLPVRSIRRIAHSRLIPPIVVELGRLVGLIYRSNKWVGRPRNYIHYMQDPPQLVCDVAGRRLFIVGGTYRVTARGIEG
jgi:Transglutaminase-like superfamily